MTVIVLTRVDYKLNALFKQINQQYVLYMFSSFLHRELHHLSICDARLGTCRASADFEDLKITWVIQKGNYTSEKLVTDLSSHNEGSKDSGSGKSKDTPNT